MKKLAILVGSIVCGALSAYAQQAPTTQYNANTKFEQMGTGLPTTNTYRTAAGSTGRD